MQYLYQTIPHLDLSKMSYQIFLRIFAALTSVRSTTTAHAVEIDQLVREKHLKYQLHAVDIHSPQKCVSHFYVLCPM